MKCRSSLLLVLLWILAQGCGALDSSSGSTLGIRPCVGSECQAGAQNKAEYNITLSNAGSGIAGTTASNDGSSMPALCAVQNPSCDPDDVASCRNVAPALGQGGDQSSGVQAFPKPVAGASAIPQASAGAAGDSTGLVAGGSNAGGVTGNAAGAIAMACRVQRDLLAVLAMCEPSGPGALGAPCVGRANCAAGFACVEENGTAQCRPYCCRGVSSCPVGTYCDLRPTKELVAAAERLSVSVCMSGTDCRFDDPYPCPPDRTCSCPSGRACGVVRADGTTACVTPGIGTEGQPCPCAAGHVCADALGSCLKVCSLTSSDRACADGICQASASLPSDWGICVSSAALL